MILCSLVLHSWALRDVVTLSVESVFILVRSKGLTVFAGVSSSVNCHLTVSLAEWTLVMFPLLYVSSSFGWVHHVRMFFPSSFASLAFSLRVQFLSGLFSVWLPYPGLNPVASIVTLRYSFRLTPTSTSLTVLICVVGLSFCFPHYSSLCLPDGFQFFCHGPFWFCCRCPW